jgi:hypothetical protein
MEAADRGVAPRPQPVTQKEREMSNPVRAVVAVLALAMVTGCGLLELGEPVEPESAAALPDDWPPEFPDPPPGAVLVAAVELDPDDNPGMWAHLADADVVAYYQLSYDIDEHDMLALFTYYEEAFAAAGWQDVEIADDPRQTPADHTGFTFHGYGVRGHLGLYTGDTPAGISVDLQVLR